MRSEGGGGEGNSEGREGERDGEMRMKRVGELKRRGEEDRKGD